MSFAATATSQGEASTTSNSLYTTTTTTIPYHNNDEIDNIDNDNDDDDENSIDDDDMFPEDFRARQSSTTTGGTTHTAFSSSGATTSSCGTSVSSIGDDLTSSSANITPNTTTTWLVHPATMSPRSSSSSSMIRMQQLQLQQQQQQQNNNNNNQLLVIDRQQSSGNLYMDLPLHSDFTIPTANTRKRFQCEKYNPTYPNYSLISQSPPKDVVMVLPPPPNSYNENNNPSYMMGQHQQKQKQQQNHHHFNHHRHHHHQQPPPIMQHHHHHNEENSNYDDDDQEGGGDKSRRPIFGRKVQKRYKTNPDAAAARAAIAMLWHSSSNDHDDDPEKHHGVVNIVKNGNGMLHNNYDDDDDDDAPPVLYQMHYHHNEHLNSDGVTWTPLLAADDNSRNKKRNSNKNNTKSKPRQDPLLTLPNLAYPPQQQTQPPPYYDHDHSHQLLNNSINIDDNTTLASICSEAPTPTIQHYKTTSMDKNGTKTYSTVKFGYDDSTVAADKTNKENNNNNADTVFRSVMSPLTPSPSAAAAAGKRSAFQQSQYLMHGGDDDDDGNNSLLTGTGTTPAAASKQQQRQQRQNSRDQKQRPHETIHAQSLLLGLAFMAVWTPSNMMAPNLTNIALDFGFTSEAQRDLYLGSYCALATGVFSLPMSAAIGICVDVFDNRKLLFVGTCLVGAAAAFCTAYSQNYWQLFLARLINGGCMSGTVPVAFSFLGDLFDSTERNAASSGLTAMMGVGIIMGQVYAGTIGSRRNDVVSGDDEYHIGLSGWAHAFVVSGSLTVISALLCLWLVKEPVRGGKEKVLQDMLRAGTRYERKLTWEGFCHTIKHNNSNRILLWQGLISSFPWGILFVFLNDFLSQERGFSVPDATYLVAVFGVGCAAGGILGGYCGQQLQRIRRSYLPLFMALTTFLGVVPFLFLLNTSFTNARGFLGHTLAILAGLVASLPSVNVRPCLINVNPPETRGAALTAANLLINVGRGFGPSCITLMVSICNVDRKFALNVTLPLFWTISALQLTLLANTLPKDQDSMETELASYAAQMIGLRRQMTNANHRLPEEDCMDATSIVSIEDRMTSFDSVAARETLVYVSEGFKELQRPFYRCGREEAASQSSCGSHVDDQDVMPETVIQHSNADAIPTSPLKVDLSFSNERTPLV